MQPKPHRPGFLPTNHYPVFLDLIWPLKLNLNLNVSTLGWLFYKLIYGVYIYIVIWSHYYIIYSIYVSTVYSVYYKLYIYTVYSLNILKYSMYAYIVCINRVYTTVAFLTQLLSFLGVNNGFIFSFALFLHFLNLWLILFCKVAVSIAFHMIKSLR